MSLKGWRSEGSEIQNYGLKVGHRTEMLGPGGQLRQHSKDWHEEQRQE